MPWAAARIDAGFCFEVFRAFGRYDHDRDCAVTLLAAVEQSHWLDDPARVLMIFEGDRSLVEPCSGIGRGMLSVRDCDASEVLGRGAVGVQIALSEHGDPCGRGE